MNKRYPSCIVLFTNVVALLFIIAVSNSHAQGVISIDNGFASVSINTDQNAGRFWFSKQGGGRYTYNGGGAVINITSNVIFRVSRGSIENWYTNAVDPLGNGGVRPENSQGEIDFQPYDHLYVSPGRDTVELIYLNLNGLTVTQRFVAEEPRHEYDDGADILLEFDWEPNDLGLPGTTLGVFLMIDHDNANIVSSVGSDNSSLMTDRGYYPSFGSGGVFQRDFGGIPEYTLTGWFEYTEAADGTILNDIFSIHRLRGSSLRGAPLTTPNEHAIGRWQDFRQLSWLVNGDVNSKNIQDAATVSRWEGGIGGRGLIRTAFGTTSKAGNNFFHCRDSNVFVVIRTERVVQQEELNGPYTPEQFQVEMWVTNLHRVVQRTPIIRLRTPIRSFPDNTRRLRLDTSTLATQSLILRARETQKITWLLNVNPLSNDTLAELEFLYRDSAEIQKPLVPFLDGCNPLISFKGAFIPPPPDDRPPIINRTGSGRDQTFWWTFRTYDRHAGYIYDTGLDRIEIIRNDNSNFRLLVNPNPFRRCDTTETVTLRAEVVDTTRIAGLDFRVFDCEGNSRLETVTYSPRPDTFKPEVTRIDSIGRFDPQHYPCAVPVFEVYIEDQRNQTPSAGDNGLGSIEVLSSINFEPIQINFDQSDRPIADFDKTASFRLRVTDTLLPANATVRIADFAGNADTLAFSYCPLPDVLPPVITFVPGGKAAGASWTVSASDTLSWDRGLMEIVEISKANMSVTPWPVNIVSGQPTLSNLSVEVIDDAWPAEVTLEVRDTYYDGNDPSTFADHSSRIQFTFNGTPDTLAPNIIFHRDSTVPADEVVFTVLVNDTHEVNGEFYRFDRGLKSVTWSLTSNMQIRTPISFTDNRRGASFQVEIIDLLAIVDADTVCVIAIDSAGNRSTGCTSWPSTPDGKSPIFVGGLDPTTMRVTGIATDNRDFDRGLDSIFLQNEKNLQSYSESLAGKQSTVVSFDVVDPSLPIAGELVVQDLYGEFLSGPEQLIHTVVIQFSLPVVSLNVSLPGLVEGGDEIVATVSVESDFSGDDVTALEFELDHTLNGTFIRGESESIVESFTAVSPVNGRINVAIETIKGREYKAGKGEVLGTIRFLSEQPYYTDKFNLSLIPGSFLSNRGEKSVVEVRTDGDPLASTLTLPTPFFRTTADSLTIINGGCNRVLTSTNGFSRPNGIAILDFYPQPVVGRNNTTLTLLIRELPENGANLTLFGVNGNACSNWRIESGGTHISEVQVDFPTDIAPGLYFLRLQGESPSEADQIKILVE